MKLSSSYNLPLSDNWQSNHGQIRLYVYLRVEVRIIVGIRCEYHTLLLDSLPHNA